MIQKKVEDKVGIKRLESNKLVGEAQIKLAEKLRHAKKEDIKIAWCSGNAPTDIFSGLDILWVLPETHSVRCSMEGATIPLCEEAEARGYSQDLCSFPRVGLGSIFNDNKLSPWGGLPKPDVLYAVSNCRQHIKWFETISKIYNVPLLILDTPIVHDEFGKEELNSTIRYIGDQLKEHIVSLEQLFSRRYNWSKLEQSVYYTQQGAQMFKQILEAAKNIPAPLSTFDHYILYAMMFWYRGLPDVIDVYNQALNEINDRIAKKIGVIDNERFRLYIDNMPIYIKMGLLSRYFASRDAVVIASFFNHQILDRFGVLDPKNPIETLAKGQATHCCNIGTEGRVTKLLDIYRDYSLNGLIMQVSRTCRVWNCDDYAVGKALEDRYKIPRVVFESDMLDPRQFSDAQVLNRIGAFMDMLDTHKG